MTILIIMLVVLVLVCVGIIAWADVEQLDTFDDAETWYNDPNDN